MAIGFPTGTVSALTGLGDEQRMMRIRNPTQLDNSGSPLLDRSGNVVGIVARRLNPIQITGTTSRMNENENINFAVSLKTIKSFLDSQAVHYVLKDSIETKSYADLAAEAMRYTVLLECIR
jgi:S1-C subfamily serine protease